MKVTISTNNAILYFMLTFDTDRSMIVAIAVAKKAPLEANKVITMSETMVTILKNNFDNNLLFLL